MKSYLFFEMTSIFVLLEKKFKSKSKNRFLAFFVRPQTFVVNLTARNAMYKDIITKRYFHKKYTHSYIEIDANINKHFCFH